MARDCAISYCMKIKVYACRVSVTVSRAHCWVEHDYQPLPETCLCLYIHDAQWIQITTLIIINHSSARPLPETCVYGYSGSTYTDVRIRPLVEAFGPSVGAWMPCQRTRLLLPCRYLRAAPTRAESGAQAQELLRCFSWRLPWPPSVMRTCTDCLTGEQRKPGYAKHRIGHLSTVFEEGPSPLITWQARGNPPFLSD